MTWVNAVVQGVLLGGVYALFGLAGSRADVRADADHQPRPRRHRRARGLPDPRRPRPLERLAVPRHRPRAARDARRRVRAPAYRARTQPSLGRPRAAPDDLRAVDRDPESAAREVLARRPVARRAGRLDRDRELAGHKPDLDLGDRSAHAGRRDRHTRRTAGVPLEDPGIGRRRGDRGRIPRQPRAS